MTRRLLALPALLLAAAVAEDTPAPRKDGRPAGDKEIDGHSTPHRLNAHADGSLCSACHGQLVSSTGVRTPVYDTCFKALDDACAADDDRYSFCHDLKPGSSGVRGLRHILKVENWKLVHCHWAMEDLRSRA